MVFESYTTAKMIVRKWLVDKFRITNKFNIMKKLLTLYLIPVSMIIAACTGAKNITSSKIGLVKLDNYFTKNTELPEEVNFRVITNAADFENNFGVGQTANSNVIRPEFGGQM